MILFIEILVSHFGFEGNNGISLNFYPRKCHPHFNTVIFNTLRWDNKIKIIDYNSHLFQ